MMVAIVVMESSDLCCVWSGSSLREEEGVEKMEGVSF